jgi:GT2 family glycosyltransferase/glycosyltransferase involved in cell wall biosynthesis
MSAPVSVLVPVYRGVGDVAACLESVVRHGAEVPFELLVIDDASPQPAVSAYVDEFGRGDHGLPVRVLRNPENLGFVRTVNRGLAETTGDVVILNADTQVTAGWLDRMVDAASEGESIATVTPLTNFGSICTIPRSVIDAFDLAGESPRIDACAELVARAALGLRPSVITGVGFCMLMRRTAIDMCAGFDEESFGQGYGEEVDFCLRASRIGFRHVVEDATFVFHHGGGSFGSGRRAGLARGSALLHGRYGFFRAANRRERVEDPLAVPFAALELALHERDTSKPQVLHVLHSSPGALGGTEKHLRTLIEALGDDFDASILFPVESGFVLRRMWFTGGGAPVETELLFPGAPKRVEKVADEVAREALAAVLAMERFDAVHIHNLINHSLAPLEALEEFDGPVVCSVRDLYLACPHHWLLYRNETACGIPDDLDVCATCLPETRGLTRTHLEAFRAKVVEHLGVVDHWVFASQSAADYMLRVYDLDPARIDLVQHGAIIDLERARGPLDEDLVADEPLRLGFVGMGWPKKGLDVVNRLADRLAGSGIEMHHFGKLRADPSTHLHVHGPYDNEVLPQLLDRAGIQVVLLPAPYAETFGHVLTEAFVAGRPVIGTSYGALGERIRDGGLGWTVDPDDPAEIEALVRALDRHRPEILRAARAVEDLVLRPVAATADRYANMYRRPVPSGAVLEEGT